MKKVLLLLGLLMAFMSAPIYAQEYGICGTTTEQGLEIRERLFENRKNNPNFERNRVVTTYVPIRIHLVAKDDGTLRATDSRALDMLCVLNEEWEALDIQFYLKGGINHVDNEYLFFHENFDAPNGALGVWDQANDSKVNDAINIFVTSTVGGSGGGGTTLAYYTSFIDCIFVRKQDMLKRNVIPHEVGHFFSLNHPFLGWEESPWNVADHGLQVGPTSPTNGILNERVTDPNCGNANVADGICDTPPDYLFGFGQSGCGQWSGGTMDPDGVVIDPLENNTMSYFTGCPEYLFTEDQIDAIHMDLESNARNYVNPGITPSLDVVDELVVPVSPIGGEERPFNAVWFEWEPVSGATHYILEVDRVPGFDNMPIQVTVPGPGAFVDFLLPNFPYYWRVRPFNEYSVCESTFSNTQATFNTNAIASKVEELEGVNSWMVRPNPASTSDAVFIDIETSQPLKANVNLYNITGQLISSVANEFTSGRNTVEIASTDLAAGLYMVSIQGDTGVMTKRLVIR